MPDALTVHGGPPVVEDATTLAELFWADLLQAVRTKGRPTRAAFAAALTAHRSRLAAEQKAKVSK